MIKQDIKSSQALDDIATEMAEINNKKKTHNIDFCRDIYVCANAEEDCLYGMKKCYRSED